uniref:[acyl-carrier-protein] S-malonyltransferase n=1 Tax=Candidatus Kentrum sp. FM TaxID=2126340 RepID=A0A450X1R0_9GAMM|nr:MAG: [acyl-carrier-protein] S-malonyltransferase/trans-AT polyketide synthase, acyltransferase and oxidoreductase domain-containing protein [Candidatus Kentron sp. FM]VFJ74491.1 MAG: [acyl-carrier-protein] S-malonyltransferase/trans-AT polyketide synthase, acyltransferase and oxidoreductase domain-containing protein [Candidatus Kentron sp. FM]VFK23217.1 MAG: [acyl-carrier-protein] S-malonyltransferase/trans-AT polyketide synthase, acyltransferase and oxidoreductase domain-containing protein [C
MERVIKVGTFVGQGTLGKESDFRAKHPSVAALFEALKISKPTIALPQISAYRASTLLAAHLGVEFDVVLGHSVGEYSALTAAGIIPSSDIGSRIISTRQDLMDTISVGKRPAAMVTPHKDSAADNSRNFIETVKEFVDQHEGVSIGLYNSPTWLVVVGSDEALDSALKQEKLPFTARRLPLKGPFHSEEHYKGIAEGKFRKALAADMLGWNPITKETPAIYSNVTGRKYLSEEDLLTNLVRQIYLPVLFFQAVERIYRSARDIGMQVDFFDIGPGDRFMSKLIQQTLGGKVGYRVIPINTEEQATAYRIDSEKYVASLK